MRRSFLFALAFSLAVAAQSQTRLPISYTTDVMKNADSTKTYEIHVGHINFLNSLGKFRPINTTLTWRPLLKVWQEDSASYMCRIPQYADGLFTFTSNYNGSNYTLRASPMCAHVAGVLLADDGSGQSVMYTDAFGAGIDLRVWATPHGLLKVIIIREKPASITADMYFDFQMVFPVETRLEAIRDASGTLWDRDSDLSFRDRLLKLGETGKEIYFNPALVWDSAGRMEPVDVKIYKSNLKYYLRKTISQAFLASATYPVCTDHPTDFYPGAGDGFCGRSNAGTSWNDERSASDAETANYTTTASYAVEAEYGSGTTSICRAFFPFDISAVGDSTITAASFYFYRQSISAQGGSYDYINIVSTTQASTTALVASDFSRCGTRNNPAVLSTNKAITTTNMPSASYTQMAFTSAGIDTLNDMLDDGRYAKLGMRTGFDMANVDPSGYSKLQVYYSEYTGTGYDPKLVITATSTGTSYPGAVMFVY